MKKMIPVWDLPTRLFHWCLCVAVFYSWFSIEILEDMQQHFYAGYAVCHLLLFRLLWGLVGSHYARFKSFPCSPTNLFNHVKDLRYSREKTYLGHNPLGSLSAILMIVVLFIQASLGLFSSDDYFFGPLSGLINSETVSMLSEWHTLNSNAVFALIGLHIAAIFYYKLRKKQSLTQAMISGEKVVLDSAEYVDLKRIKPINKLLALIIYLFCVAATYWLATAFLDRLPTLSESYY